MTTRKLPPHGSEARYKGTRTRPGCRCPRCTRGNRRAATSRDLARLNGRPANLTPAEAAALLDHIRALLDSGMSQSLIARQAGVSQATISCLLLGKTKTCHRRKAERILAVRPGTFDDIADQPAHGAQRRVRALYWLGHGRETIAAAAGLHPDTISGIANGRYHTIDGKVAAAVRRAYRLLHTEPGTNSHARTRARKGGWHGPLAWGEDIDNPAAVPDADTGPAVPRWRALGEDADELVIRGDLSWEDAAARLGVTPVNLQRAYHRWRTRTAADPAEPAGEVA